MRHWYSIKEGVITPCYETPRAKGDGMRATTLVDARKLSLVPSVTDVISVISKPELVDWLQNNAIESAYNNPVFDEWESLEDYKARIREHASQISQKAMDFGTRIHDAIEKYLTKDSMFSVESDLVPFVEPTLKWLESNVIKTWATEAYVGCPRIGCAGRLDLSCTLEHYGYSICDVKTKRIRNGKPTFYPEWALQLAAYSRLSDLSPVIHTAHLPPSLISIVIDSGKPSEPHIKVWDDPEKHWRAFLNAYELWCYRNNFDPRIV